MANPVANLQRAAAEYKTMSKKDQKRRLSFRSIALYSAAVRFRFATGFTIFLFLLRHIWQPGS